MRDVWHSYELEQVNYQNKCRLIRGWDDLFTKVKEHINSVSAMKLSPYYKVSNSLYQGFITQPWLWVCQKYVGKRKGAVKMCMTVLKMRITCKEKCDRNVCELWIVECALFRLQS